MAEHTHAPCPQGVAALSMASHPRQRGAVLAIALILLVVMTLLAVAALRGTLLESRMAAGQRDRSVAFQAAEAGLRAAEDLVRNDSKGTLGQNCTGTNTVGCGMPNDAGNVAGVAWTTATNATVSETAAGAPQYIIQRFDSKTAADCLGQNDNALTAGLNPNPKPPLVSGFYRVFARSHDPLAANDRALVILSSNLSSTDGC